MIRFTLYDDKDTLMWSREFPVLPRLGDRVEVDSRTYRVIRVTHCFDSQKSIVRIKPLRWWQA